MKKLCLMMAALMIVGVQSGTALAAATSKAFTVSATVPASSGISIVASSISSSSSKWTTMTGTTLSFDPLNYDATNKLYLPDHFFAIAVAPTGTGTPDVTVTYSEGANPNSAAGGHGLGWKATATFMKVGTSGAETLLTGHGKKMLKDLTGGERVLPTELTGGYLRVYLGIVTKNPSASPVDPASSEMFTNSDAAGLYDGTLTISATAV